MKLRRWLRRFLVLTFGVLLILLLAPEWPAFANDSYRLQTIIGQRYFDFVLWEAQAFAAKGQAILTGDQRYIDEATRKQIVLDYLDDIARAQQLESQITAIYADPEVPDPNEATLALQEQLGSVEARIAQRQVLAEAIVQEQVGAVLADEGFALFGSAFPPVLMHMTELPLVLVTSHRDRIEKVNQISLVPGVDTPARDEMETAVFDDLNLAALIVPIGGAGTFPSMIIETSSINYLADVTAHEWAHHWLTLRPLGLMYPFDPEVRIINETVASIVEREIGPLIIERFYPEFLAPKVSLDTTPANPDTDAPPPFDFRAEMAQTRVRVDELLAEGRVEDAEAYMEARRQHFVANGYRIRKLNQAYFAFYGAYAAEPGGAQGGNPIGPMLRDIRAQSTSLRDFLEAVAPITSFADLEAVHARVTGTEAVQ